MGRKGGTAEASLEDGLWWFSPPGIHTLYSPLPHWIRNYERDSGLLPRLGHKRQSNRCLNALWIIYLGNTRYHVIRILQQSYCESAWQGSTAPCQKAVLIWKACMWVPVQAHPPAPVRPSDDSSHSWCLNCNLMKEPTPVSWPTETVWDNKCLLLFYAVKFCSIVLHSNKWLIHLGSFYFSRSLEKEEG